jgi:hypothetical protein
MKRRNLKSNCEHNVIYYGNLTHEILTANFNIREQLLTKGKIYGTLQKTP